MAYQVAPFQLTVPAGTPKTAPVSLATPIGFYVVTAIEMTVPRGFNGAVGWRFTSNGDPIIPADRTSWIVANDTELSWPIVNQISSGAWGITAYNTGINNHTLYVRYLLDLPTTPSVPSIQPIPINTLIPGGDIGVIASSLPEPP